MDLSAVAAFASGALATGLALEYVAAYHCDGWWDR